MQWMIGKEACRTRFDGDIDCFVSLIPRKIGLQRELGKTDGRTFIEDVRVGSCAEMPESWKVPDDRDSF